jgi:outer membrane lipoprotein-sorting protein
MKASRSNSPADASCSKEWRVTRSLRIFLKIALLSAVTLPTTGCFFVRTRTVDKTVLAPNVRQATLDELLKQMADRYAAVNTLNMSVNITASTGGARQGQVKDYPTFAGYMFLRKPEDLRVLMLVPFVRSRALDMVSDGKNFKLLISAPKAKAIVGPEVMTTPSKSGLENLRPGIIRDALQIPPVGPNDFVALTMNFRLIAPAHGHKEAIEEPDYDLTVLRQKPGEANGHVLQRVRVIHISRITLLPYEQDLYDDAGRLVTTINYAKFQKFGDVMYPMSIFLKRPIDEYTLQIDVTKLVVNQPLDDEQFKLTIPEGVPVQQM